MNHSDALARLEKFKALVEQYHGKKYSSDANAQALRRTVYEAYGTVEDVIERFVGRSVISVPVLGSAPGTTYPNLIEAGYLSGSTIHMHEGYAQLLKVIGKVRALVDNPSALAPKDEASIAGLIRVLSRFRECCQYVEEVPSTERHVQDIVWIMLRSHFDRLDREETLQKFGVKNYRPDFGVPELRVLVEIKFIGERTTPAAIQEELLADIPGYLSDQSRYESVVCFVYDAAHKLRDPRRFVEDLRSCDGILDVIVVPGIG